uniref:Uncharacterized protein n=1 Tax=Setaria digitata TaxID=48799 RepID=A0A915PR07_9BILA
MTYYNKIVQTEISEPVNVTIPASNTDSLVVAYDYGVFNGYVLEGTSRGSVWGVVGATFVVKKIEDDELADEMQESSDSESEIEPSVYERRRELNAWRTVLAEKLFIEARRKLYTEKLNQLEKRQAEVLSQEAADFIKKKEEILKAYHDRLQYIEVIRALRTESLKRRTIGQLECAQQNLNNNKRMAYEKVENDIWTKIQKLDDDMKRCTREYVNFCREFERSKERERRKRKRYPVANVIERLLGDAVSSLIDPYDENVDEDLYVCEQALKAVNGREN